MCVCLGVCIHEIYLQIYNKYTRVTVKLDHIISNAYYSPTLGNLGYDGI